ncbi:MAG: uL30 family ribosomal protein [Candidatus Nanohaloarchaeota archaeon QJJ-7]|nr:uL30 family ribosomal protein [Candidatus Nanohaloarchaeota archaeon QJJ-7]
MMIAVVRVRGIPDTGRRVSDTLESLRLEKKHSCVLLEDNSSNRGMLDAVKDYVAYGDVDEETAEKLREQGEAPFSLSPPSKGFRDPKTGYNQGGSLGERDDMEELLERML